MSGHGRMGVIEAVTVIRYRVKDPPKCWRRRGLRATRERAYRDAAWAKIRERCECEPYESETGAPAARCRYHDREYRASGGGPDWAPEFQPPAVWRLPRSRSSCGGWDYGRAVAYRLARFYAHVDAPQDSREAK